MVHLMWYLDSYFCYLWAGCSLDIRKPGFDFMGIIVISKVGEEVGVYVPCWRSVCNSYPLSFSILVVKKLGKKL